MKKNKHLHTVIPITPLVHGERSRLPHTDVYARLLKLQITMQVHPLQPAARQTSQPLGGESRVLP
jgi:hypothetical protein